MYPNRTLIPIFLKGANDACNSMYLKMIMLHMYDL